MKLEWKQDGFGYWDLYIYDPDNRLMAYVSPAGLEYNYDGAGGPQAVWPEGIASVEELKRYVETIIRLGAP